MSASERFDAAMDKQDKAIRNMDRAIKAIETITNDIISAIEAVDPGDRTDMEWWILKKLAGDSDEQQ